MNIDESPGNQQFTYTKFLSYIVALLIPVAIVLLSVRIIMSPLLLKFEYATPGFPPDPYGFTKTDRLYWSNIALDYLFNPEGIDFLTDLKFEDGNPVYNARELRHMLDVKNTVRSALSVLYITIGILILLGFWAWKGDWWDDYRRGLSRGGWFTVFLIGGLLLFILLSFGFLFVAFHNVFFQPGTWMFNFSDTLIRLFPQRFWRDLFLIVGGLSLSGGLILAFGAKKK